MIARVSGIRSETTEPWPGSLLMSIAPRIAGMCAELPAPWRQHIDEPVAAEVIARLSTIPEFVRSYEPDGMQPHDFITFGAMQKTLTQFVEVGWAQLESYAL